MKDQVARIGGGLGPLGPPPSYATATTYYIPATQSVITLELVRIQLGFFFSYTGWQISYVPLKMYYN